MADFNVLLKRVLTQAQALAIPVSKNIHPQVQVNRRAVSRFGCCTWREGAFIIELSARLEGAEEAACLQTLAHEVLHTCPGCQNHGPLWKGYAHRMNQAYGYQISRTGSWQALGLGDTAQPRHVVACQVCGKQFGRTRSSKLIQHPEQYRCHCGGTLEVLY